MYHYATTCATLQSTTLESQYSCHEKSGTAFAVHKFTSFFVYQYRPNLNLRSHYTLKYVYIYFTNHIGSMYVFFSLCSTQLKRYTRHQKKPSINSLFKDVYMVLLRLLSFVSWVNYTSQSKVPEISVLEHIPRVKNWLSKNDCFWTFWTGLGMFQQHNMPSNWPMGDWGKRGYSCHLLLTSFLLMLILLFVCHF